MRKRGTTLIEVKLRLNSLETPEGVWTLQLLVEFGEQFGNKTQAATKNVANPEDVMVMGTFWRPKNVQPKDVVAAYAKAIGERRRSHGTLAEMCKPEMRRRLWGEMQDACIQMANLTGGSTEDVAIRAGDASVTGEIEAALGYARQIILGRVGHLQMCPEQLAILRSPLGSISPWVRCIMSSNDLVVLERFGYEAALILSTRSDLGVILGIPPYNCNLQPIIRCLRSSPTT